MRRMGHGRFIGDVRGSFSVDGRNLCVQVRWVNPDLMALLCVDMLSCSSRTRCAAYAEVSNQVIAPAPTDDDLTPNPDAHARLMVDGEDSCGGRPR